MHVLGFTNYPSLALLKKTSTISFKWASNSNSTNLKFCSRDPFDNQPEGDNVAKMMGCDGPALYMNFLKPRIKVGNEFVTQGRNVNQVTMKRLHVGEWQTINDNV